MCYSGKCPYETHEGECSKPMRLNFSCWLYDEQDTPEEPETEEEDPEE